MTVKCFWRLFLAVFLSAVLTMFSGCRGKNTEKTPLQSATSNTATSTPHTPVMSMEKTRALWLSCYDMKNIAGYSKDSFEAYAQEVINNVYSLGYNTLFLHIRAFGDALYKSSIFPFSKSLTGTLGKDPGFDPLEIFIAEAGKKGIKLHGWINPYRMSASDDEEKLLKDSVLFSFLKEGKAKAFGGKFYLDPGQPDCIDLVLRGVKEVLENYNIDGIHFDDYFYPTTSPEFDADTYKAYTEKGGRLSLEDWRRANVNSLVASVYRLCEKYNKPFGISPSAHISQDKTDKNFNENYADIPLWLKEEGFVHYITPQLYFGYAYKAEAFRFDNLLELWKGIPKRDGVLIFIGIGAYKIDEPTAPDGEEWEQNGKTLVLRQMQDCIDKGFDGYSVFSYRQVVKYELNRPD